ncbi:hypothetical protein SAMN05518856_10860 [Paenibacillus sp. OK003]|nr:hypothetical protein SAMN05518856_10860 [Paenibacillus sp. OK003]
MIRLRYSVMDGPTGSAIEFESAAEMLQLVNVTGGVRIVRTETESHEIPDPLHLIWIIPA